VLICHNSDKNLSLEPLKHKGLCDAYRAHVRSSCITCGISRRAIVAPLDFEKLAMLTLHALIVCPFHFEFGRAGCTHKKFKKWIGRNAG
jgi:hypothetical protein